MCWHKWGKWSEPRGVNITRTYSYYYKVEKRRCLVQDRTCKKCGKYQWREIN